MRWALADAGLPAEAVEYINAHGTSTPANDVVETQAIKAVFGEGARRIPISSTKSMIGHAMGASGAIEAVVCALTLERASSTPRSTTSSPTRSATSTTCRTKPGAADVRVALSNSFGLGGQNACLVLRRVEA